MTAVTAATASVLVAGNAGTQPGPGDLFPATAPVEARGLQRDAVRLLAPPADGGPSRHAQLHDLPRLLREGDLLVVNASAVLPASLPAVDATGERLRVHLSTDLGHDRWLVEVRRPFGDASRPFGDAAAGWRLDLPEGGQVRLLSPYGAQTREGRRRLWTADVRIPGTTHAFLHRHGRPIRYGSAAQPWPLDAYQSMFATEPGSAESPSAGRGFTPSLVARLQERGIALARIVLHTGVSSQETGERPYPERYRVPAAAAKAVTGARASGGRVIAVGTTVTRALETAARRDGTVVPSQGWTELVVTPQRGVRVVDGLLSGWHEPEASHVQLLEAVAGRAVLDRAYAEALAAGYRGHEFGDLVLLFGRDRDGAAARLPKGRDSGLRDPRQGPRGQPRDAASRGPRAGAPRGR